MFKEDCKSTAGTTKQDNTVCQTSVYTQGNSINHLLRSRLEERDYGCQCANPHSYSGHYWSTKQSGACGDSSASSSVVKAHAKKEAAGAQFTSENAVGFVRQQEKREK